MKEALIKKKETMVHEEVRVITVGFLDMLGIFLLHRRFILVSTTIVVSVGLAFFLIAQALPPLISYMPDRYEPKITMLIGRPARDEAELMSMSGQSFYNGSSLAADVKNTDLALHIIGSAETLDTLVETFNLAERYRITRNIREESRKVLLKKLGISVDAASNMLTITFSDTDRHIAQEVLIALERILEKRFTSLESERFGLRRDAGARKIAEIGKAIEALEVKSKDFVRRYGILDFEANSLAEAALFARLRTDLLYKEIEIAQYSLESRVEDAIALKLKGERKNLLKKIQALENGYAPWVSTSSSDRLSAAVYFEYEAIRRELLILQKVYTSLIADYEASKLAASGRGPVIMVIEMPEVLEHKTGPNMGKTLVILAVAVFAIACVLSFVLEYGHQLRSCPEEAAKFRKYVEGGRRKNSSGRIISKGGEV